ncbi:MAG TPA: DUF4424 family protein [Candidatus Acidoferrum sp.]|nr:DUF4424 family protein [Candidatus Acidoferrum sp.]
MGRTKFACALGLIAASALPLGANDTFATLASGGLVPMKTSDIVMQSEDLQISVHEITIHYLFRNTSDRDIDATVAFPLPDLDGGTVYNEPLRLPNEQNPNFLDFRVTSGGTPISVKANVRAFSEGRDITSRLASFDLPPSVLLAPLNCSLMKLEPGQRSALEKEELIVADGFNPSIPCAGKQGWWATWTMRVGFYWEQRFPAKGTVDLLQTYRPVVGGSYIVSGSDGSESARPYCGGADALRQIKEFENAHPAKKDWDPALIENRIEYILTTANNWSGPIGNFYLSILADTPQDIVLTCMPGLKRVTPVRYELNRSNFHPDQELKLLILQLAR